MPLEIKVLGGWASYALPKKYGKHFSLLLDTGRHKIWIDPAVPLDEDVDAIIITQSDADHYIKLDSYLKKHKDVPVYSTRAVLDQIVTKFPKNLKSVRKPLKFDGLQIIFMSVPHKVGVPAVALKVKYRKHTIGIVPEFNFLGEQEIEYLKNSVLIAGVGEYDKRKKDDTKATFTELIEYAKGELSPKRLYLTNLRKNTYDKHKSEILKALKEFNGGILLDGASLTFNGERKKTDGLYLIAPHAALIYEGIKSMILKSRKFDIADKDFILCDDTFAYGVIKVDEPEEINSKQFDEYADEHLVTREEMREWGWSFPLYAYRIKEFTPYDDPIPVNLPHGIQTFVKDVEQYFEKLHLEEFRSSGVDYDIKHIRQRWREAIADLRYLGNSAYPRLKRGEKWGEWTLDDVLRYFAKLVDALRSVYFPLIPPHHEKLYREYTGKDPKKAKKSSYWKCYAEAEKYMESKPPKDIDEAKEWDKKRKEIISLKKKAANLKAGYYSKAKPYYRGYFQELADELKAIGWDKVKLLVDCKWDGLRMTIGKVNGKGFAFVDPEDVKEKDPNVSKRIPAIIKEIEDNFPDNTILDGEFLAIHPNGKEMLHRTCLHEKTKILTEHGWMNIREICEDCLPVRVYTYNEKTGNLELENISEYHINKGQFEWINIDIGFGTGGRVLTVTPDHPIYTKQGWKRADELAEGDEVLTYEYVLSKDERQIIIGTLFGDAWLDTQSRRAMLAMRHSIKQAEYLRKKAYFLKNLNPHIYIQEPITKFILNNPRPTVCQSIEMYTSRLDILDEFKDFYDARKRKQVLEKYLNELDLLGLTIWFMDDGSVWKDKQWNAYTVSLHTEGFTEEETRRIIRWFKERWGINGHLSRKSDGHAYIRFYGKDAKWLLDNLYWKIDFENHHTKEFTFDSKDFNFGEFRPVWKKVKNVKRTHWYSKRYNIDVPKNHNYFADGLLVHNCANSLLNSKASGEELERYAIIVVFDIIYFEGEDLRNLPLHERLEYLSRLKPTEHIWIERIATTFEKKADGYICDGSNIDCILKAAEIIRDAKNGRPKFCAEGVMLKRLDGPYESPQNHYWMKVKFYHELDLRVLDKKLVKGTKDVYNYYLGYDTPRDYAEAYLNMTTKDWYGKVHCYKNGKIVAVGKDCKKYLNDNSVIFVTLMGKSDNHKERTQIKIGDIIRIAAEEVLRFDNEKFPEYPRYSFYIGRVLEPIPEKDVTDSLETIDKLSSFEPQRIPIEELQHIQQDIAKIGDTYVRIIKIGDARLS